MSIYKVFYSCLPLGGFIVANHIRVITVIIFSQLVVLYFGFRMDVSLTELLTTVAIFLLKLFGKTVTNFLEKMLCCWLFYFVICLFLKVGISWPSFFGKLPLLSW